jgi:hypothetical protein
MTGYELDYVVFCQNSSGVPDIFETIVRWCHEDACPSDLAGEQAAEAGYDGPYYAFEKTGLLEVLKRK